MDKIDIDKLKTYIKEAKEEFNIFKKKTEKQKFQEKQLKKGQTCFCYCDCGNELISSNSLVKDTDFVYFKCSKCGKQSKWDFDCPCPILIEEK